MSGGEKRILKLGLRKEQLERLRDLLEVQEGFKFQVLGFILDLQTGSLQDQVLHNQQQTEFDAQVLSILLSHYVKGRSSPPTSILIKFEKLPGGYAYEKAFLQRAVQPIAKIFGQKPSDLIEAAKLLGGRGLTFGDSSVEIPTLTGIPIVFIVWAEGEFPASATVLFDESASSYIPTEDLAVLAELTSSRLIRASRKLGAP